MNNIWYTSIFIPDPFNAHPIIVIYEAGDEIEQMMSNEYRTRVGDRYVNRWCYVNDLLNYEKALEIAKEGLKRIDWCATDYGIAQDTLDKITALTKGSDNGSNS